MPVLFIAHGNPVNALTENLFTKNWQALITGINKPDAILCISAHWETAGKQITSNDIPPTIHDFTGFPPALFQMQYEPKNNRSLCQGVIEHLADFNLQATDSWGLDHGCWTVLKFLYPEANIPVMQISLDRQADMDSHWAFAKKMGELRYKNILIIGSGNIVHNITKWMSNPNGSFEWGKAFNNAFVEHLKNRNFEALKNYRELPYALDAVPSEEHYLPAIYTCAMSEEDDQLTLDEYPATSLENCSMTSFKFA